MKVSITYDDTLYQLVPIEPTIEQQDAMVDAYFDTRDVVAAYKAGLSAAPTPPAQPAERMPLTDEQRMVLVEVAQMFSGDDRRRRVLNSLLVSPHGIKGES